jgi:tetratricopeptide (TPR) repeat protein
MGGVGKTQLALEYCLRMKVSGYFRAIFWLDASSRNSLYHSIAIIAQKLLPGRVFNDHHDAATSVRKVLSIWSDAWLMVFDNLDLDDPADFQDIQQFFPYSRRGFILVTSRHPSSNKLGQSVEVGCMDKDEGLRLLQPPEGPEELSAAEEILTRLGYLPLAVDQARVYISKRKLRLRDFLNEYDTRRKGVVEETPRFWQYCRMLPDNKKIPLSLITIWEMSLPLLGVDDTRKSRDVLTLFSFFHSVNISEKIFSCNSGTPIPTSSPLSNFNNNSHWDHLKFEDVVMQMQELSLVQISHRNPNEIVVSLHSMVSEWLRMRLDENAQSLFLTAAISHLENYLNSTEYIYHGHTTRQEALLHLDTICHFAALDTKSNSFFGACFTFGVFYAEQGRLEDAEKMYNRALAHYEKVLGYEHTSTLNTVYNLGKIYNDQGRLEDAEKMYNCALTGKDMVLGSQHESTLDTIHQLGNLHKIQGRLEDAERMLNRALSGKEEALGLDHKSTLDTVYNLGNLYKVQDRPGDAENMYNRALAGKEKALGPCHTSTLNTVNSLGILYKCQGRLEDAERMYNRALAGKEKALGLANTSTFRTVKNLGVLYKLQGRLEDAEKMYNRALAGYEAALGPDHKSTLDTIQNLENLYKSQGRLEDMERVCNDMKRRLINIT